MEEQPKSEDERSKNIKSRIKNTKQDLTGIESNKKKRRAQCSPFLIQIMLVLTFYQKKNAPTPPKESSCSSSARYQAFSV